MRAAESRESWQELDLYDAVMDALWRYDPVREELGFLDVQVAPGGKLTIRGNVRSSLIRDGVLETLERVHGVREIEDRIIPDFEVEVGVAQALATEDNTRSIQPGSIAVRSHLGAVKLSGKVDESMLDAILQVVRGVAGVRSVEVV
jgi:osmotically-inducible protein OsmY